MRDSLEKFGDALFRKATGRKWDSFARPESLEALDEELSANLLTARYPVRVLGHGDGGIPVVLSEEDRASGHMHVMAAPDMGKSSFLELLIRGDIERGYGACLVDASERGDTALRVLKWCCSRGFDKVLYVNPNSFGGRVPTIQPLQYGDSHAEPTGWLMDTLQVLWATEKTETPRIERFMPALLHALHAAGLTLAECKWFMARESSKSRYAQFRDAQRQILEWLDPLELDRKHLEEPLFGPWKAWGDFQSTVNRLNVFNDPLMRRFVGSRNPPVDWDFLVRDGWLVLANLDCTRVWGPRSLKARLVGTLLLNEVIRTVSAIFRGSGGRYRKPFYCYVDECGELMTPKVAEILDLKRKTPLKFTLSHQRYDQVADRNILSSIRTSAAHKVMFYTPNQSDRHVMMQDLQYGGDLVDRDVMYALGEMRKRHAAIRVGTRRPVVAEIADVEPVEVPQKSLTAYVKDLQRYEWFHAADKIDDEIDARFASQAPGAGGHREEGRNRPQGARQRPVRDGAPAGQAVPPEPQGKGYFDD